MDERPRSEGDASFPAIDEESRRHLGIRAVVVSLGVLGLTAVAQGIVFVVSDSAALLADLVHNVGDALTGVPVGLALWLRSPRGEYLSGIAVVAAIAISGVFAAIVAIEKIVDPEPPAQLLALGLAGALGVGGNLVAATMRGRAGRRLNSPALVADGHHAQVDALVSAGVVLTSVLVALGWALADPIIALAITAVIGHITWHAWQTVRRRSEAPGS